MSARVGRVSFSVSLAVVLIFLALPPGLMKALCDPHGSFQPDSMYRFIETRMCCEDTNDGRLHWWTIEMRNRSTKTVRVVWKVLTPAYGGDTDNCCDSRIGPGDSSRFTFRTTAVECGGKVWHQILSVKEED